MTTEQIFFTADHHFGHKAIINHADRPFESIEEMDEALIDVWNKMIRPNDIVFYLGDISFHKGPKTDEILARLNGRIRYLLGNHDKGFSARGKERMEWIKAYYEFKWGKKKPRIVLCHYPFEVWNKAHYGAIHLYGHSHGRLKTKRPRRFDVGVDTNPDFRPYALEELVLRLETETPEGVDHHRPRGQGMVTVEQAIDWLHAHGLFAERHDDGIAVWRKVTPGIHGGVRQGMVLIKPEGGRWCLDELYAPGPKVTPFETLAAVCESVTQLS